MGRWAHRGLDLLADPPDFSDVGIAAVDRVEAGVQPEARVSILATDRHDDAGRLDAVAGCEFVDDRIRLLD